MKFFSETKGNQLSIFVIRKNSIEIVSDIIGFDLQMKYSLVTFFGNQHRNILVKISLLLEISGTAKAV